MNLLEYDLKYVLVKDIYGETLAETLEQAEKIGVGTRDYELITMK
jgi:uncharacterized Fe-S center protein